jgi:hypothetical protein
MRNIVSKNARRQKAVMSLNTKLAQQQAVASSTKPLPLMKDAQD